MFMSFGVPLATIWFRACRTWRDRLRGLLGTDKTAQPVVLCGCSSIHTVGMSYALDVALVARDGTVLASEVLLPPGRLLSARDAWYAFERPHEDAPWPQRGTRVSIGS